MSPPTTLPAALNDAAADPTPEGNLDAPSTWLCVSGVEPDDTLNLRAGPGTEFPVLHELPPSACDAFATGNQSPQGASGWIEVDFYDHAFHVRGWVNDSFVREAPNPCYWEADACGL